MLNGRRTDNARCHGPAVAAGIAAVVFCFLAVSAGAQVYKVVDEDGNVTYTDQAPPGGAEPMELPDLSVVDTDYVAPPATSDSQPAQDAAPAEPTPRELRKMYSDFKITRPMPEETFWGTANQVVVSWGSSKPLEDGMTVKVYVDGTLQSGDQGGMLALTLDRGEHTVYAELFDARGRRVVTSGSVTFFVKQHSVGFNRPQAVQIARS